MLSMLPWLGSLWATGPCLEHVSVEALETIATLAITSWHADDLAFTAAVGDIEWMFGCDVAVLRREDAASVHLSKALRHWGSGTAQHRRAHAALLAAVWADPDAVRSWRPTLRHAPSLLEEIDGLLDTKELSGEWAHLPPAWRADLMVDGQHQTVAPRDRPFVFQVVRRGDGTVLVTDYVARPELIPEYPKLRTALWVAGGVSLGATVGLAVLARQTHEQLVCLDQPDQSALLWGSCARFDDQLDAYQVRAANNAAVVAALTFAGADLLILGAIASTFR